MKFKEYLSSLISKRKLNTPSSSKCTGKQNHPKSSQDLITADCHYDICGYEDINSVANDDQQSRTQILLNRHAELVNTIVESRSPNENALSSCLQCRVVARPVPSIPPPPVPPPLPPKLLLEQQVSFTNRNYSSTLATCSPRRECQHHHRHLHHQEQQTQSQQSHHQTQLISSHYSTPTQSGISSSSSSLWTTTAASAMQTTTASLSKKQRSKIRTNPWIGNTQANNRTSTLIESPSPPSAHPEYSIYDPTFHDSPTSLIHSESFPQRISNASTNLKNSPSPPAVVPTVVPTSSIILHQSDSGHGFSLSSSRVIDSSSSTSPSSSSSPALSNSSSENCTSGDGILMNGKQNHRQKKPRKKNSIKTSSPLVMQKSTKQDASLEQYFSPHVITSDAGSLTCPAKSKLNIRKTQTKTFLSVNINTLALQIPSTTAVQYRYQRQLNAARNRSSKSPFDLQHNEHNSLSSSSRSIDDQFSLEFEEILENERLRKQRKDKQSSTKLLSSVSISPRNNPFILPLDETNIKLPSPPPILFPTGLTKTNSRAILKHIEEIENEIRLIKNLDLTHRHDNDEEDEFALSPNAYPEKDANVEMENHVIDDDDNDDEIRDERPSINEQVDQWVEKCLKTVNNTNDSTALLQNECDHLSKAINDYIACASSNNDKRISPTPTSSTSQKTKRLLTAFYLSSIPTPTTKRTSSFIDQPSKLETTLQTVVRHLQPINECPF